MRRATVLVTLVLWACTSPEGPEPIDETEAMFDKARVLDIAIDIAADDWDALRIQGRGITDIAGPGCLEAPLERVYDYYPATVTIDGEVIREVAVRKKGLFGSLNPVKPSLKVKFDEYVPKRRFAGLERMTLNNAISDPGYVNQCLGYQLFADAGIPAPRCSFANVTVNGDNLGIYVHVESVKKDFLARHYDDNDGNLYEGTISDFRPDLKRTFERKTNELDADRSDLDAVVVALDAPDDRLVDELDEVVDVEEFLSYWAMEVILGHSDGYAGNTNNFFVYANPDTGRFEFLPWGIDAIFRENVADNDAATMATGALPRRLAMFRGGQTLYANRVHELLDGIWDEDALTAEVDRMASLLGPYLLESDTGFADRIELVRDFIATRRETLTTALQGAKLWDAPLRNIECLAPLGNISLTFSTEWGAADRDPLSFSASMSGTFRDDPIEAIAVGSLAFAGGQASIESTVGVLAVRADGNNLLVLVDTPKPQFAPGANVPLDWSGAAATLYLWNTEGIQPLGHLAEGSVRFTAAETKDSAVVTGTLSATIFETFPNL